MWHKRVTVTLAVLAVLLLLISGPGTRAGLWPFRVGFGMFAGALFVGLAAAGAAIVGLALPRQRSQSGPLLVAALMLGAASAAVPLDYVRRVKTLPYINDITTDHRAPAAVLAAEDVRGPFCRVSEKKLSQPAPARACAAAQQAFARAAEAAKGMTGKSRCSMNAREESKPSLLRAGLVSRTTW
jgi:hypothetical protein